MNDLQLTDLQQAILLIIRDGRDDELNKVWKKQIESLFKLNLIEFKPNTQDELMLTVKGQDCLVKNVLIKYPLHHKGQVGSFNEVLKSMDPAALDALLCAIMNEHILKQIPRKTARVFGQHLLDIEFYKKWGSVLISKWKEQTISSMDFFTEMNKKK